VPLPEARAMIILALGQEMLVSLRKPSTFVCTIDISGSMGAEASLKRYVNSNLKSISYIMKEVMRRINLQDWTWLKTQ
jgi:hypothetical protein